MENFDAIINLHNMLKQAGIEHTFRSLNNGYQVVYPSVEAWDAVMNAYNVHSRKWYGNVQCNAISAVLSPFSWGRGEGKLEIMGMLTEDEIKLDDIACVTPDEAFRRIAEAEEQRKEVEGA